MHRSILVAALLGAAILGSLSFGGSNEARAERPPYLLLQTPWHRYVHRKTPAPRQIDYAMETQPYAYGWFGARTRRHDNSYVDQRNMYTQWTEE